MAARKAFLMSLVWASASALALAGGLMAWSSGHSERSFPDMRAALAHAQSHRTSPQSQGNLDTEKSTSRAIFTLYEREIHEDHLSQNDRASLHKIKRQCYEAIKKIAEKNALHHYFMRYAEEKGLPSKESAREALLQDQFTLYEERVSSLYEQTKDHPTLAGRSPEEGKKSVRAYLISLATQDMERTILSGLQQDNSFQFLLRPPEPERFNIEHGPIYSKHTQGGVKSLRSGSVQDVVVFRDLECPFSKAYEDQLKLLMQKSKHSIDISFKDFPLPFHSWARPAALVSHCAGLLGGSHLYHSVSQYLFANQSDKALLKQSAAPAWVARGESAAKRGEIWRCFQSAQSSFETGSPHINETPRSPSAADRAVLELKNSLAEAEALGVKGTPVTFINGRKLEGVYQWYELEEILSEESDF